MQIRLWNFPYNAISIWFSRENIRRCEIGWGDVRKDHVNHTFWWAIFGFSGTILLQTWPSGRPVRKGWNI